MVITNQTNHLNNFCEETPHDGNEYSTVTNRCPPRTIYQNTWNIGKNIQKHKVVAPHKCTCHGKQAQNQREQKEHQAKQEGTEQAESEKHKPNQRKTTNFG